MTGSRKQTADARKAPKDQRTTAHGGVKHTGAPGDSGAELPHERDESAGSPADASREEGRGSYEDAKRGVPDTDQGPVLDSTYHKLRRK